MSIWTELLFQHGHIVNVDLARALAGHEAAPATASGGEDADGVQGAAQPARCASDHPSHGVATLCATALSLFR